MTGSDWFTWFLGASVFFSLGWCFRAWFEPRLTRLVRFDNADLERSNQQLHAQCTALANTNAQLRVLLNRSVPAEERAN